METSDRSAIARARRLSSLLTEAGLAAPIDPASADVNVTSLTDDSRLVQRGACFVAVRGVDQDGHAFVNAAVQGGAAAVVVERDAPVPAPVACVRVDDSRVALARLAAAFHGLRDRTARNPKLVGVTGTNGKTTVTWMLRSILRAAGRPTALLGTIGYDLMNETIRASLTTPGAVALCRHVATARDAGAEYVVLEASSHALAQRRTDGLTFAVAVFTNLSGDHLDFHRSMEAYFQAKKRLFDELPDSATAVINRDDPVAERLIGDSRSRVLTFGVRSSDADFTARLEVVDATGSRFLLQGPYWTEEVHCPLVGLHNVSNALAAAAAATALGVNFATIRQGLEATDNVPGRLQRVSGAECPFSVLVDYAHTDDALRNVLDALRPLTSGRLICVFGCGGDRDPTKRPRMAAVVERFADVAYVTSDNPRKEHPQAIIDQILAGFTAAGRCRVEVEPDRARAIAHAVGAAQPNDTVLIAGKGHEDYQLMGDRVLHFDDAEVARACLSRAALTGCPV